jgi:hypothetical protein
MRASGASSTALVLRGIPDRADTKVELNLLNRLARSQTV